MSEPKSHPLTNTQDCVKIIDKNSELIFKLEFKLKTLYVTDRLVNYLDLSDLNLFAIIDLLLENNQAVKTLTLEGFDSHIAHIVRNTSEILTRIVAKSIFYKSKNYEPSEREKIDISSDKEIEKALGLKRFNRNIFIYNHMKDMFKDIPYWESFSEQFKDIYQKLSSFSHPESQIKSLLSRHTKYNEDKGSLEMLLVRNNYNREKSEKYDPYNYLFLSSCNILTVYFILELFKNIIKVIGQKRVYFPLFVFYIKNFPFTVIQIELINLVQT